MALSSEERNKRKIEYMLNRLSSENNISHEDIVKIYRDYLSAISEIGIEFVEKEFLYYFTLRMKNDKNKSFTFFKDYILKIN